MSAEKEFDNPFAIATLTQPIGGSHCGRILSSVAYGLSGSRKRKRAEIVVSSDGEGIHIYNVQTSRVVASYAVPPQASFNTTPCCVYRRPSKGLPARRCTYSSTVQALNGAGSPQVICFDEESEPGTLGNMRKLTFDIPKERSDVVAIEAVPTASGYYSQEFVFEIIVVYQDGKLDCLSSDLQTLQWTSDLRSILPSQPSRNNATSMSVGYAYVTNALQASRGLFKGRDDVVAILQGSREADPGVLAGTPVVVLATTLGGSAQLDLHAFSLRPALQSGLTSRDATARHLVSWRLPKATMSADLAASKISVQADTGTVTYLAPDGLVTYRLHDAIPKEVSYLGCSDGQFRSFLRLTPSLALAVSDLYCGLFDLTYQTLQATLRFSQSEPPNGVDKKRSRGVAESTMKDVTFIGYFAALDLAVGSTATELVGFPLGSILPRRHGKKEASLLIDSIGKGLRNGLPAQVITQNSAGPVDLAKDFKEKINLLDEQDDVFGFEREFAEAVGIERDTTEFDTWAKSHTNGTNKALKTNGTTSPQHDGMDVDAPSDEVPLPSWNFPARFDIKDRFRHEPLAMYALSKLFSWAPETKNSTLPLKMPTIVADAYMPNIFQYLLLTECFNKNTIQRALRIHSGVPGDMRIVNDGDVVTALVDLDPSFGILRTVLESGSYLSIGEVTSSIKLIVQRLGAQAVSELNARLLLHSDPPINGVDNDQDVEKAISSMSDVIDDTHAYLDNMPSADVENNFILFCCFQGALKALYTFPKPTIVAGLRTALDHDQLFVLLNLLRIQLSGGGWASRYFDSEASEPQDDDSSSDDQIIIIANLLSTVLDTIGVGGWLLASQRSQDPTTSTTTIEQEDSPETLIHDLHEVVSAVAEGIHEVTFMNGLLSDFLRYEHRLKTSSSKTTTTTAVSRNKQHNKKPYKVSTASDALYGADAYADSRILPLGMLVKDAPALMKNAPNGTEVKKSMRQIGYELSKMVPKYSVERIEI
ncbi:hypothetical protein EJ05DRAFT_534159 [Pseudovirgaria hyperparasitica]|uniref:Uncharacterized protein n=1 Tax=Pseudovirgaria hyperparasitica TaxID=470096 RepID=A0A6A6WKF8_9PEZI|nr:uncharacterized protein EJ05DRAFT_534159 [Pseudovirgaria hyperparasitica]KAF2762642.1 hypothetical protein EJ05DRAFT_534159 [Pseudovirgaria hyperparasitica]